MTEIFLLLFVGGLCGFIVLHHIWLSWLEIEHIYLDDTGHAERLDDAETHLDYVRRREENERIQRAMRL